MTVARAVLRAMLAASVLVATGARVTAAPGGLVVATAAVAGTPFGAAVTSDGRIVFVSVTASRSGDRTGIAVFRRSAGALAPLGFVPLRAPRALGVALLRDESALLVADGDGLAILDARAARRGAPATVRYVTVHPSPGSSDVVASPDGRTAYAAEPEPHAVGVFALRRDRGGAVDASAAGSFAAGLAPSALVLDGRGETLYAAGDATNGRDSARGCARGAVVALDARTRPVRGRGAAVPAGCAPAQIALTADGSSLWIALRGEDRAVAFSTARLRRDPSHAAVVKSVPAGPMPSALALVAHDGALAVANSNRFDPSAAGSSATFYDVRGEPAVINGVATAADPVRFGRSPDGSVLYLTNGRGRSVQMLDAFHAVQPGE